MAQVLLVDDDPQFREVTRRQLEHRGHSVHEAGDSSEAKQVLDEENIEILLLDYILPGQNGEELAQELVSRGNTIPIIFISGADPSLLSEIEFRAALMTKPLNIDHLDQTIASLIEKQSETA